MGAVSAAVCAMRMYLRTDSLFGWSCASRRHLASEHCYHYWHEQVQ